jgi:hypothetical protein
MSELVFFISCDANNFQLSQSQRRVIQNMNRYINENIKPNDQTASSPARHINHISLNEWIQIESNTNAMQLIRHVLTKDTRKSD